MRTCLLAILVAVFPAFATERVTATGKVVDSDGKPIGHAAVWFIRLASRKALICTAPPVTSIAASAPSQPQMELTASTA